MLDVRWLWRFVPFCLILAGAFAGAAPAWSEASKDLPPLSPAAKASPEASSGAAQIGPALSEADLRRMARDAASAHALPAEYFVRLIARESRFDLRAVSPAGALGISQFMPTTAASRGLSDPFDPAQALPKSAEYLRDLRLEFGNLGLAAAAYNAGPARVRRWLAGESRLPAETLHYVLAITGRQAEAWAPLGRPLLNGPADDHGSRSRGRPELKNWELALLLSINGTDPQGAPVRVKAADELRLAASRGSIRRAGRRVSAAAFEQLLCSSCIIRQTY